MLIVAQFHHKKIAITKQLSTLVVLTCDLPLNWIHNPGFLCQCLIKKDRKQLLGSSRLLVLYFFDSAKHPTFPCSRDRLTTLTLWLIQNIYRHSTSLMLFLFIHILFILIFAVAIYYYYYFIFSRGVALCECPISFCFAHSRMLHSLIS